MRAARTLRVGHPREEDALVDGSAQHLTCLLVFGRVASLHGERRRGTRVCACQQRAGDLAMPSLHVKSTAWCVCVVCVCVCVLCVCVCVYVCVRCLCDRYVVRRRAWLSRDSKAARELMQFL